MRARYLPPPGGRGLRGDVPAGRQGRARRPRRARGRDHRPHGDRLDHGREQRDRRDPATRGDRPALPREGRLLPHRLRAGLWQDPARRRGDEHRPHVDLRPQDLRTEGHRRALRPSQAARAHAGAHPRWRPGARHALGNPADAALRRAGRGGRDLPARDGAGDRAPRGAARPLPVPHRRAPARGLHERRRDEPSPSPMSRARGS